MKVRVRPLGEDLIVEFNHQITAVSFTVDGGIRKIDHIVFAKVRRPEDIELKLFRYRSMLGEDRVMVFLTAVTPSTTCSVVLHDYVLVVETAGFENTFSICNGIVKSRLGAEHSTINIAVYVDRDLALPDLLELIQTVTYAKSAALIEWGVTCRGRPALGTTSDATLVACRELSSKRIFAGPLTDVGFKVIHAVYRATSSLLRRYLFRPLAP